MRRGPVAICSLPVTGSDGPRGTPPAIETVIYDDSLTHDAEPLLSPETPSFQCWLRCRFHVRGVRTFKIWNS